MSIGQNIRHLRESHGMNQSDLASIAGVSDKAVSTWENDQKIPRMGAIQKIADYFGIPKSAIIEDDYTIKETPAPEGAEAEHVSIEEVEALIPLLVRAGYVRDGSELTEEDFLFVNHLLALADAWFSRQR